MTVGDDYYRRSERGYKRRRLSTPAEMARRMYPEPEKAETTHEDIDLILAGDSESQDANMNTSTEVETSSREELIERIKRGEKPTWVPKPGLEALLAENGRPQPLHAREPPADGLSFPEGSQVGSTAESCLLDLDHALLPEPIERPRSAFHAGDFHERSDPFHAPSSPLYIQTPTRIPASVSTSPPPWLSSPPHPSLGRARTDIGVLHASAVATRRNRAPSLGSSFSSAFILRVPTSPLVHAVNNTSLDFLQQQEQSPFGCSPDNNTNKRRTLPPESFQHLGSPFTERRSTNFSRPLPTPQLRRDPSSSYQNHQPRRSLNSFTYQPAASPQTPTSPRSRRPSFPSEPSPIQHASMVGSFEESILRGRMSTAPSKPLDFVAQIGVLGKGNCQPSLKCPAHVTVPFPAVFYRYPTLNAGRSPADDSPSPYVGTIDLEHNLKPVETTKQRKQFHQDSQDPDAHIADITAPENTAIGRALARDARKREKRSISPKAPPGGCYRVPQQGQLQIIIKNPNKTAVKLFLVPYDLEGMEAGTKTFVRQRSFTAGAILEQPLSGSPEPPQVSDPLKDKQILRYLIHLKFCCPSRGRFYLYDNVRVVFANRVPDGKEKLRNEVQLPDPKYSIYRSGRDMSMGAAGARLAAEKAFRRRSSGFGTTPQPYEAADMAEHVPPLPTTTIPFHIGSKPISVSTRCVPDHAAELCDEDASFDFPKTKMAATQPVLNPQDLSLPAANSFDASSLIRRSPIPTGSEGGIPEGRTYSPVPPEPVEGLLSKKFREHKKGHATIE